MSGPQGLAIDGNNDIFIADTGNNRIVEVNGLTFADSVVASNGATFSAPTGVAVDAAGDVYVSDTTNGLTILYLNGFSQIPVKTGLSAPKGIALDGFDNIYLANTGDNNVIELNQNTATANLGSVTLTNSASQTLYVYNTGNQQLAFNAAAVLSGSTDFSIGNSSTCTGSATVNPGGVCTFDVTFAPTATGVETATITLSDNGTIGTDIINLTGTGASAALTPTTTALVGSPNPIAIGMTGTLTATVAPGACSGTVKFYYGSLELGSGTLSDGVASITASTAGIPATTYTITADYQGTSSCAASSGTVNEVVQTSINSTTTLVGSPNPIVEGATGSLTATITPSNCTGTVKFYYTSLYLGEATVTSGVASLSEGTAGVPPGNYLITADYSGGGGCNASSGTKTEQVIASSVTKESPREISVDERLAR
jgi:hypothetical protein